jgi:hypothetical protein
VLLSDRRWKGGASESQSALALLLTHNRGSHNCGSDCDIPRRIGNKKPNIIVCLLLKEQFQCWLSC